MTTTEPPPTPEPVTAAAGSTDDATAAGAPTTDASDAAPLRVAIFDDVVAARHELFHIPGLDVTVFPHADDATGECSRGGFDVVFMDYSLGPTHKTGGHVTAELRAAGFRGRIIGISSDPASNAAIRAAGADDALPSKAHLRSYLVHLGATHTRGE